MTTVPSISNSTQQQHSRTSSPSARILSIDIECFLQHNNALPNPRNDSILQISSIAAIATRDGHDDIQQFVFTLDTCAAIDHVKVLECKTEHSLLKKWRQFFLEFDPDVVTGYCLKKFDLRYLIQRAERMGISEFPFLGRVSDDKVFCMQHVSDKRATEIVECISGRMVIDMHDFIREHYSSLSRYSLDAVSQHFLGKKKDYLNLIDIPGLQMGDEHTRQRLAKYCVKDAKLAYQLFDKLWLNGNV